MKISDGKNLILHGGHGETFLTIVGNLMRGDAFIILDKDKNKYHSYLIYNLSKNTKGWCALSQEYVEV